MLVMLLGTTITLSSCGGDDSNSTSQDTTAENVITINGQSYKNISCTKSTRSGGGIEVKFDYGPASIEFKFKEQNPSGNVTAEKVEIEYENNGYYYEAKPTNVPCNISISDGKCIMRANNINVVMTCSDNGKKLNASVSISYNGNIYVK